MAHLPNATIPEFHGGSAQTCTCFVWSNIAFTRSASKVGPTLCARSRPGTCWASAISRHTSVSSGLSDDAEQLGVGARTANRGQSAVERLDQRIALGQRRKRQGSQSERFAVRHEVCHVASARQIDTRRTRKDDRLYLAALQQIEQLLRRANGRQRYPGMRPH